MKGYAYHVYLIDPALDYVPIEHVFYGLTKQECLEKFRGHQDICANFGPAIEEGRFDDDWEEGIELPTVSDDPEEES